MRTFGRDLRYALRMLSKSPGFTLVTVLTLALGIAANTAVFGWIDTVLLRPISGVASADRLMALSEVPPDGGTTNCTHPDFRDYQRGLTQASGVVASRPSFFNVGPVEYPRRVLGQVVSANFFAVLGVQPFLGRMFLVEEDQDAQGAFPIAVISHRLWSSYFHADAGVVGRAVRINGHQLTVVGVAPPDFGGTMGGAAMDVWVPLSVILQMGALNTWAAADRNARFLDVIVRLKPGVTLEQARAEAQGVARRIAAAYPDTHRGVGASLVPMWRASYGLQAVLLKPLRMLALVSLLVLLIACANVANLLMARSVSRQREFGIRIALGAGRGRLVRQLVAEVTILTGASAAFGVLLAWWMGGSFVYLLPTVDATVRAAIAPLLHPQMSTRVLAFTALASVSAAVLAAILPALSIGRMNVNATLKEGGRSGISGVRSHRARGALVVAEVALAGVALIGAGLAVRSFQKMAALNPGFDPNNVLVAHFQLSTNGYGLKQEKEFNRNLRMRLEAAPGIAEVSYADSVPLSLMSPSRERVQVEGSLPDRSGVMPVSRSVVAPGYFKLMGIPLIDGRDFTEQDDLDKPRVIIVNQTFAKRYFDGQDPIGRMVRVSGKLSTVVGLVKDSKYRNLPEGPTPFFYGPFRQIFFSGHSNFLYIRAAGDMASAGRVLRREVAALDRNGALYEAVPLIDYAQWSLFGERAVASLLSVLGMLSVLLAAAGLYSVMAYAVSERTQEFGVRMALGARQGQVLGMVLRKGLVMTALGLATGAVVAIAGVQVTTSAFEVSVSSAEPVVFAGAALFLLLVALLASYAPARRATKVDPIAALRAE